MPIIGWRCPVCKQDCDLDHFAKTHCGLQIHPDYASAVLQDRAKQEDRTGVRVSGLTGCPRSAAILKSEDIYVDPLVFNAALTGTAWHALMEQSSLEPDRSEVSVSGTIDGIAITGTIDRVREIDGKLVCEDFKHGNDFARKYATLKPEYIVQVSLYAELYAQTYNERPVGGVIWRHFTGSPAFIAFPFALWSVDDCLAHQPYGGGYRVRDLLHQAASVGGNACYECAPTGHQGVLVDGRYVVCLVCNDTGRIGQTHWRDLPLAGETMSFGARSFCSYCDVEAICKEAATGAPW